MFLQGTVITQMTCVSDGTRPSLLVGILHTVLFKFNGQHFYQVLLRSSKICQLLQKTILRWCRSCPALHRIWHHHVS